MGVPKFFRYTSERYPCLNELVKQYQIPDFDNMYLDMNGIIHNCSHPDDSNPHFRITEEKIFEDIFHYIGILFQIIKPKKLFFMAIDGVAPRAKMNQQRGRRFRSAREAERLEEDAKSKGEVLPEEKRFDSNCITPGTVFMARLHEQLRYFVKEKMSTDPLWTKVKVVLSGHETPGEGEHKIMDYIRWARSQPDYDPNTRHCLYGLDADLIMLGMCTHEPHFALLREEVKFGRSTQRATSPEQTNFYLLHLSLLREYLDQEFIAVKDNLPFEYDIEKIVDDWVLMGFLVGNDFIPHLPNMHISNDALPLLYKTYMEVLPTLDGYINEAGDLNLTRFELFMQHLAKIDKEKFQDTYTDLKYFEAKTGRRPNANERKEYKPNNDDTFNVNIDDIKAVKPDDELQALIDATQDMFMEDLNGEEVEYDDTSDEEANFEMEFVLHKMDYYMNKLDYSKVTPEVLANQAEGYVRAIQWNLFYYYKGCPSWCWYYPHHYAPYISDIKGFTELNITFDVGEPFKPFEQLLAVLPSASKHLLPTPFHDLMTDEDSPIVHYYPINFETDLNGKKNDWEAVVLIPFIDEVNLLSAMEPCYQRLTEDEKKRNTHGPMLLYKWTQNDLGPVEAPEYFPSITSCHSVETQVWRQEIVVPDDQLKRGMLPNANREILFPGFPTMRHLKYKTSMKKGRVKVFDQPSRNESMIIELLPEKDINPALQTLARDLLGKVVWVSWPHLIRAKVISVSNEKTRLHLTDSHNNNINKGGDGDSGAPNYSVEHNNGNLHKQWISERSTIIEHNMNRLGIELGDVNVIIHAVNLKGYKYTVMDQERMATEEVWCSVACGHALQAVVATANAPAVPERYRSPRQAYPPGDTVFLRTRGQYYGCEAIVIDTENMRNGRIKLSVKETVEPTPTVHTMASPYTTANHAAASCGISGQMLSRITGTILVVLGERNDLPTETQSKLNLGLNLKFNKKNQEVSGYTRRCGVSNAWLYSGRCVQLVRAYAQHYPDLFDRLAYSMGRDMFFESDLWPNQVGENKPQEVSQWLKSQPHSTAARRQCGSEALEPEEMRALWDSLQPQLDRLQDKEKRVNLQVKWNLLYKPELHEGNILPDLAADFKMYDRVVCVARHLAAPAGARGTIVAVCGAPDTNPVRLSDRMNAENTYLVMFDEPFPGGQGEELFEDTRFYRMMPANMLNISFGRNLRGSLTVVDDEPFGLGAPPTVLRREDGHHSAFANYSPPRDIKTPVAETRPAPTNNTTKNGPESQDKATHLLRSLLKISEDETAANVKKQYKQMASVKEGRQPKSNVSTANMPTANIPTANIPTANIPTANIPTANIPTANTPMANIPTANIPTANIPTANIPTANIPTANVPTANIPTDNVATTNVATTYVSTANIATTYVSTATKASQPNWRLENNTFNNSMPMQQMHQQNHHNQMNPQPMNVPIHEWTNSNYKPQPTMPLVLPYPAFGQCYSGPGPTLVPLPQFHNPGLGAPMTHNPGMGAPMNHNPGMGAPMNHNPGMGAPMNHNPGMGAPMNHNPGMGASVNQAQHTGQRHFPQPLSGVPTVLAPSWAQPQVTQNPQPQSTPPAQTEASSRPTGSSHNHVEKIGTPFVPLQVQTCHRRVQNQPGPPIRKELEGLPAPKSVLPQPTAVDNTNQPKEPETKRPQRRRKQRIAANLPGLND